MINTPADAAQSQPHYDAQAALATFIELGCTPDDARTLINAEVDPAVVGTQAPDAVPFVDAALHHDLWDINERLAATGGDGEAAWAEWQREYESNGWEG